MAKLKKINVKNIKHPLHNYDTQKALNLARDIKYGPTNPTELEANPLPTLKEAIKIITDHYHLLDHTWVTGVVALETLKLTQGKKINFSISFPT